MTPDLKPLSAAVLAGGHSSRMGQNKALMRLVPGGKPMLALVIDRLRTVVEDLMIIANDETCYADFGVRVVPDSISGSGALGGVHSAIKSAGNSHCLIVACDMPFLNLSLLQRMAAEPRDYDVFVPVAPGESRQRNDGFVYQTLHAIYGEGCLEPIETQLRLGKKQVVGFFDSVAVKRLEMDEVREFDPQLRSFLNVNTPESFAAAMRYVHEQELGATI